MFPERFTVDVCAREVTLDGQYAEVEAFAAPVTVPVYGWGPPSPDARTRTDQAGLEHVLDVYAASAFCSDRDRVIVDGATFTAIGDPEDFNHGPFGFTPGFRVSLARWEG